MVNFVLFSNIFIYLFIKDDGNKGSGWFGRAATFSRLFDYNHDLIPPDPNFFSAGFFGESDDKYEQSEVNYTPILNP